MLIETPQVDTMGAIPVRLWFENLHGPVSLWDLVNRFDAGEFARLVGNFAVFECDFMTADDPLDVEFQRFASEFARQIGAAILACTANGLTDAGNRFKEIRSHIRDHGDQPPALAIEAKHARDIIVGELKKISFLRVAGDRVELVDHGDLFGKSVYDAFPSARCDIRDAGNCLAAECNTAAVFHLMRVAEHGLRALARDRRMKFKNRPLELATWEDIIKGLETAEQAIQNYPQTLAREAQFEFYHGAMMEFKRFKNAFRNRIMHTRDDEYDRDEATAIFKHVRAFMVILADRISEQRRTPLVWKRA